uniref:tRNA-guanine(15) transglycosylase-like domain-containing protein n=1 Tax=Trichobilharzia regenti TaxID=157069 RepID=A0AA85K5T9_TRIRE|nr:unnamed protein product [Trichobilharzia regenti]
MIKFSVTCSVNDTLRLGVLSETANKASLNTPGCLLYTRYGSVPFLSPDIYEGISLIPGFSFASMNYIAERKSTLLKYGRGLAEFGALGKRKAILFQSDPTNSSHVAAAAKSSVPVWATGGRLQLSIAEYAKCVLMASPVAYQAPTDNETFILDKNPTPKRCKNSVVRTAGYLRRLIEEHSLEEELTKTSLLVSIAGGHDLEFRLRSIADIDFSICSGVVIDGLLRNLPVSAVEVKDIDNEDKSLIDFLTTTLPKLFAHIPSHLPRFITQIWQPYDIALAARSGCDIFDGSLPYRLSRSGIGWIYEDWNDDASGQLDVGSKRRFLVFPFEEDKEPIHQLSESEQFLPIQPECACYACSHHTRIYISHLHIAQEMLAPMLLMMLLHSLTYLGSIVSTTSSRNGRGC